MKNLEQWLAANDEYLAVALQWLHARLAQMVPKEEPAVGVAREVVKETPPEPLKELSEKARTAAFTGMRRPLLGRFSTPSERANRR